MRTIWLFLFLPLTAGAQFPAPSQSGVLLERDADVPSGEFAVRAPDNQVYRFLFDAKTSVDRDGFHSNVDRLNAGEKVEVESDAVPGSLLRYAHAVRVDVPNPPRLTLADTRIHSAVHSLLERPPQIGTLTFSGVVSRLNAQSVVLRTREGEQTLLIRQDTRYVDNGDTVEAAELRPNMRVFIRAGKNLYEQLEAYQVIWGTILDPKRR